MATRRLSLVGIAALTLVYGCSPVTLLNTLAPGDTYVRTRGLAYGPESHMRLDVYQPRALPKGAPVVVFFYGGSWSSGNKDDYLFVGEALASRGIVTVIADYRLYPEVRYPAFLEDCGRAVAWTSHNIAGFGGNPGRLFVSGHSAGAYNAAMIALDERWLSPWGMHPSELAGLIGLAGPYNFLPIIDETIKIIFDAPNTPLDSQPIAHVTDRAPPALFIVAKNDRFVYPDRNTEVLAQKLREHGDDVTVKAYGGLSHETLVGSMARPLRLLAPVRAEFSDWVLARSG